VGELAVLFWLSLIPLATSWMGEHHLAAWPVALYGVVLLFAGVAYFILARLLVSLHGRESVLATALGSDFKGVISMLLYLAAIPLAFVNTWMSCAIYIVVAILWLVPDRRIERRLAS